MKRDFSWISWSATWRFRVLRKAVYTVYLDVEHDFQRVWLGKATTR